MDSFCGLKIVWILISWLLIKPADLDLHYIQKKVKNFEKKNVHTKPLFSQLC